MSYCRSLAKTMSAYSPAQQEKIFGFKLSGSDGNKGGGNNPDGGDPNNPGKGKK